MEYHFAAPKHLMPSEIDYDAAMRIEWRMRGEDNWRIINEHVVGYTFDCLGLASEVVPKCGDIDGIDIVGQFEVQAVYEKNSKPVARYFFSKANKYSDPIRCNEDWTQRT